MAAPTASPVTDPHASPAVKGKLSTADQVKRQLARDYPPGALSWVDSLTWTGPVQVPVGQVDRSTGTAEWSAAAKDTAKLALFRHKIAGGFRKPIVLVRTPGGGKLFAVDGHSRTLACTALRIPVTAWVGTAATAHGPWEQAHSRQLANDREGAVIELVGPKGFIHGWIFVGVPAYGDKVYHPHHGHGTVTDSGDHHVSVRFDSGASHSFPVRPDSGPGHFERMSDDDLVAEMRDGHGEHFNRALAEIDRRDRAEKADKVAALYRQAPGKGEQRDKLYRDLVSLGENPEDAWSHAYSVSTEAMQRKAVTAQLREQGYRGSSFDALSRNAFRDELQRMTLAAEADTKGNMLNPAGKKAGIDPWSLFTGTDTRARAYASHELREYWDQNGRLTVASFQRQLLGQAANAGPGRGDYLQ